MKTPFLGSAYVSRSSNLAAQRLVNLYPELVETREGKAVGAFYSTPGLTQRATVGVGPHRGAHVMAGTLYVVSGFELYSVASDWTATLLGAVGGDLSSPVSMIDNGMQLAVFDGLSGFCWNGSTLASIDLPFSGPVVARESDGFGLVNALGTTSWWQSDYNDLTSWNALNFGRADATPTPIVALGSLHRELWLMKSDSTEVWVDAGQAGVAFQRLQGVFVHSGCVAPFSVARMDETLVWLSQTDDGHGEVVRSNGYRAEPISTHAIATAIQSYPTVSDAVAYCYQDSGHRFYVLTFPSGNATWVWDERTRLWHERAAFSSGAFNRHDSNSYAFAYGAHVVGDWQSGALYTLDLEIYTDAGRAKKWLRSWRALPPDKAASMPVTFDWLQLDLETGITVPAGTNPQIALRWSDDGGHNWSNEWLEAWGQTGQTAARVRWRQLGSTRDETGLDRIFEVSSSDPVRAALIGADMEAA